MSSGGAALQPTFTGHVATTQDALILFEACLQGHLSHVPRRPHDRERASLIRSGSVFIYEENASGIKRWTDGVTWSPSRILGNFLVYRELDKPFPPGEKKRAMKKGTRRPSRPGEPYARNERPAESYSPTQPAFNGDRQSSEIERQLIGSLIDSYGFKVDGLVKKTMSVTVQGVTHHLVSYYNVNDVLSNQLRTPSQTENLTYIRPRPELTQKQSFRSPLEDADDVEGLRDGHPNYGYRMGPQAYMQDYKINPYYMPQQQYPPMASQPPLNTSYPPSIPPMSSPYLQTPIQTPQMPQDRSPYSQYDQSGYGRSYDGMSASGQKSVPPTPTSAIPATMPDRQQASNMMYPPSNVGRPMMSPQSNNMPYRGGGYGMPAQSPVDGQRPPQPSPVHMKFEERRDGQPQTPQSYSAPRNDYYTNGATQPFSHGGPIAQQWNAPHAQQ